MNSKAFLDVVQWLFTANDAELAAIKSVLGALHSRENYVPGGILAAKDREKQERHKLFEQGAKALDGALQTMREHNAYVAAGPPQKKANTFSYVPNTKHMKKVWETLQRGSRPLTVRELAAVAFIKPTRNNRKTIATALGEIRKRPGALLNYVEDKNGDLRYSWGEVPR